MVERMKSMYVITREIRGPAGHGDPGEMYTALEEYVYYDNYNDALKAIDGKTMRGWLDVTILFVADKGAIDG